MFGSRYWSPEYWGPRYWGEGSSTPAPGTGRYWGPGFFGGAYYGRSYWPGGDAPPVVTIPTSLQNAIKADWNGDSLLSTAVGPIYFDQAPAGVRVPYCVLNHVGEQPGESEEDNTDLIWFTVYAGSAATARALGRLVMDRIETPTDDRDRFSWTVGNEWGNLVDDKRPSKIAKRGMDGGDLYRYSILFRFFITGRP